jgi:hypothetical protein
LLEEAPQCPSRVGLDKLAPHQSPVRVSVRHLNPAPPPQRRLCSVAPSAGNPVTSLASLGLSPGVGDRTPH